MGILQDAIHVIAQPVGYSAEAIGKATGNIGGIGTTGKEITSGTASPIADLGSEVGSLGADAGSAVGNAANSVKVAPTTTGKGTTSSTTNNVTGGTTTSSPTASATTAIIGQAQTALQTALQALQASNAEVQAQESQQQNELASNQAAQQNTFNNDETTNAQHLTDAETGAKTQGNADISSLDRLIASLGGGGSTVETQEVPAEVARSVASNIAGADTTAATNDQAATVAWNTFLNQLASQKQQLEDQATQQEATNQGNYNKSAQTLAQIESAAQSGAISPSDLSYELESAVGSIPSVVNWSPSYSGTTPVYQTPSLSNFTLTPSQLAAAAGTALPTSGANAIPFLAALTGGQQKNQPALAT